MKQFNWEEFKDGNNKIAVHCKTEEEAKDFCKQMHEHGLKLTQAPSASTQDLPTSTVGRFGRMIF